VDRYPVSESMPPGARLLAHVYDPDPRHPTAATVVVGTADLAEYPGAYVAVEGSTIRVRGEGVVDAVDVVPAICEVDPALEPALDLGPALDPALVGAALHTWVFQLGRPVPADLRVNGSLVRLAASPRR
jgi:hypothetical protein